MLHCSKSLLMQLLPLWLQLFLYACLQGCQSLLSDMVLLLLLVLLLCQVSYL